MKRSAWKKTLIDNCKAVGTYRDSFLPVIETLSVILERRDALQAEYDKSGEGAVVEHTNAKGATNLEPHPVLRMINELNRDALTYWRECGLTAAGLKKIDENAMKPKKRSALADALKELSG